MVSRICLVWPWQCHVYIPAGVLTLCLIPATPDSLMVCRWTQQRLGSPAVSRGIPAPGVAWFKNVFLTQPIHQKVHTNRWILALIWRGLWRHGAHLWVCKSSQVWVKVELDADCSAGQGESSDEQHNQHNIGEGRSEVDHLNRHTCSDVDE